MNQTALQQFIEWGNQMIGDHPAKTLSFYEAIDKAEELLIVEKEQIMDAHIEGQRVFDNYQHTQWTTDQAELYYNETYKKE
jgi:hypothetical protein